MFRITIILAVLCFFTLVNNHPLVGHIHLSPKMHAQKQADTLYFQNQFTEMKTLVDYVSKSLQGKDPKKYEFLIQKEAEIQAGLNKLRQTLLKYNLPLNKQSKLCPGVTTFNRTELRRYISYLQEKEAAVDDYLSTCVDCSFVSDDIIQIKNLTSTYIHHLNQTLDGVYCKSEAVSKQVAKGMVNLNTSYFKNNLKAKNWYYGSTTASDYKIYLFKRSSTYNLTNCPSDIPFVREKQQQCFNCPVGSIFNLGSENCDTCGQFEILVMESGKCVPCNGQKVVEKGNLVCKLCILSQGELLNKTSGKCYTCPPKSYLDTSLLSCVAIDCSGDTPRFNSTTRKCEACEASHVIDPVDITKCIKTNYIGLCNPSTPKYDAVTKKCTACPQNTTYSSDTNSCIKNIQPSAHTKVSHQLTHQQLGTIKISVKRQDETDEAKQLIQKTICARQQLNYNQQSKNCQNCPAETEFSIELERCQKIVKCGQTQTLNKTSRICVETSTLCKEDQVYVITVNRCLPISMTCGSDFYYNPQKKTCIAISTNCKKDEFYDSNTRKCTQKQLLCKAQQEYDEQLHVCKKLIHCYDDEEFNFDLRICEKKLLKCNKNEYFDQQSSQCKSQLLITSPYSQNLIGYDNFTYQIIYYQDVKQSNPLIKDCDVVTPYYDYFTNKCISCPKQSPYFHLQISKCISCPDKLIYEPSHHRCMPPRTLYVSPTISRMGI